MSGGTCMKRQMTKADGLAFKKRWLAVHAAEVKELRATTMNEKLEQLAALMSSVKKLRWNESLSAEESQVRERWKRLRKAYLV